MLRVALALLLVLPAAARGAAPPASGDAAARIAFRAALPDGARIATGSAGCGVLVDVGERTSCTGSYVVARGDERARYQLVLAANALRTSPAEIRARVVAVRTGRGRVRGLGRRVDRTATQAGPLPAAERTVHAGLGLARIPSRTLSRDRWLAFAVPALWRQAYGEGPVRLDGSFSHTYELAPGAFCTVTVGVGATLVDRPPAERPEGFDADGDGDVDIEDGAAVASRSTDAAGTTTYVRAPERGGASGSVLRAGPAPRGAGPARFATLVVGGSADGELERFDPVPTGDGFRPLEPTQAQERDCATREARAAAELVPRAVATAALAVRPRPPVADPNDEGPLPVERTPTTVPLG